MKEKGFMIEITKDNNIIGACLYNMEVFSTFDTLIELKTIIDNYNNRLVNASLSNEDLAVCMFMQSDDNGENPIIDGVSLFEGSYKYMKNVFKTVYPYYEDDDIGYAYVGIVKEDIEYIENIAKYSIYVDLDKKAVGIQTIESMEIYELPHFMGWEEETVDSSSIKRTDMNPDYLFFCEISGFIKLIQNCDGVFMEEDDENYVFVTL